VDRLAANLKILFNPESVAVIGASGNPGKLGFHVVKSLTEGGYAGKIVPVNPGTREIKGLKTVPSVSAYDGSIDLAIVVVPAGNVAPVFRECSQKGVKGIVLITAGFNEIDDPRGTDLQQEIAAIANAAGIPVIGPNTFGMVNLSAGLNASFTPEFSRLNSGAVGLVSQSGGIAHLLGFLGMQSDVGFSKIIGLGNRLNIDFARMVDFLMDDPDTRVIMLYMEGIDDPRQLVAVAQKHKGKKPLVIQKTGRSDKGDQASRSHTGSLAGRHEVYQGAFRQAGLLSVGDSDTLLETAKALAVCPVPDGSGVAVLSSQAGPGMAACDACEVYGLTIANFHAKTRENINLYLPPVAIRTNPVDMGPAWYDATATTRIVEAVAGDKNVSGILLLIMFASANQDLLKRLGNFLMKWKQQKPIISCICAPPGIWDEQIKTLEGAGVLVNYATPESAARAMANLWKYGRLQTGLSKSGNVR